MIRLPESIPALVAVTALTWGACGPTSPADGGGEAVWAVYGPVERPDPGANIRFGIQALTVPFVYLPVATAFPEVDACVAFEPCALTLPVDGLRFGAARLSAGDLLAALRVQIRAREGLAGTLLAAKIEPRPDGTEAIVLTLDETGVASLPQLSVSRFDGSAWLSTGAYHVGEQGAEGIVLAASDPDRRPRRIHVVRVDDARRILAEILAGRVDVTFAPGHHLRLLETAGAVGDRIELANNEFALFFNQRHPALAELDVRRCLLTALGPALEAVRGRSVLLSPALEPRSERPSPAACRQRLSETLPGRIDLELIEDVDGLLMAHDGVVTSLLDLGFDVDVRRISLQDFDTPIEGHLRVTGWSVTHPAWPAAWLSTDGPLNVGGHADPILDGLLSGSSDPATLTARLAEDPAFVPLGVLPLHAVTSERFTFVTPPTGAGGRRWPVLGLEPVD